MKKKTHKTVALSETIPVHGLVQEFLAALNNECSSSLLLFQIGRCIRRRMVLSHETKALLVNHYPHGADFTTSEVDFEQYRE